MPEARFAERRLVATADGSHSLYLPAIGEHYHSSHGALLESLHVFIGNGYEVAAELPRPMLHVLEIGFGTGLNALLTWERSRSRGLPLVYTAIEPYPLEDGLVARLNHPEHLSSTKARALFDAMHRCAWGSGQRLDDHFTLQKLHSRFDQFKPQGRYDLVYHDAFSPDVQPELWTSEVFARLAGCMSSGAVLVTYSAKGEVRRHLRSVGLTVERLPGPPGKREMTRARQS
ncbi:MAG TPA: tRNA (5-methylaminomethyl-2-thiouridine)(34)-methyltransferase MnmD [Candidatus Accumulibacter phosphatis]|nr:MAG: tRNA 5-methylaminomethyl-2-thiouridine biosynthesis bifunctional protein MnmC [Candidatus Accumulibacter sp. SK-11]HCN67090.1 SAM-dependent methyltransferase [Accumulibacter sp.]HCV13891.1 SAM-dependent methyltransferase [Accumulibacter sp.]HRL77136.1 tRNA (5-methylaminomethyl-2-thiouridine)(34)-methyltransferase MnmD [Candidatus Accumulibacter phosphatis]HRQ95477.1 tRNA (5-methylaminomethyl-2-thiouridine)(34)-methyltransferase MnmD [Candidatus Accumulibacter phosphatis]